MHLLTVSFCTEEEAERAKTVLIKEFPQQLLEIDIAKFDLQEFEEKR